MLSYQTLRSNDDRPVAGRLYSAIHNDDPQRSRIRPQRLAGSAVISFQCRVRAA